MEQLRKETHPTSLVDPQLPDITGQQSAERGGTSAEPALHQLFLLQGRVLGSALYEGRVFRLECSKGSIWTLH